MHNITHSPLKILGICLLAIALFVLFQVLFVMLNGKVVKAPNIPRQPLVYGNTGKALNLIVMGDSITVGQGAPYNDSIAVTTAKYFAKTHKVTLYNVGVSGARMHNVRAEQLPKALADKPDVVLLCAGANDVTHFTSYDAVSKDLDAIIAKLQKQNPQVRIVFTGSPQMGSVPRFADPLKTLARARSNRMNKAFAPVIKKHAITFVPVADKTGKAFLQDHSLFAQDNFHPNARGYALWTAAIQNTLNKSKGINSL